MNQSSSYTEEKSENLFIIKIGGNIIDDQEKLRNFLRDFALLKGNKLLVHGGGKLATRMAEKMNIPQQMIDGRRVTDAETLKIITMVYGGYINKSVTAILQSLGSNAIGISGVDGDLIVAEKRKNMSIDYGYVGDIRHVNGGLLYKFLSLGLVPVLAPLTHDREGNLLNTNADTIAQETAVAMSQYYNVHLIYGFEKPGVLSDASDNDSVISLLSESVFKQLAEEKKIVEGMIPKLENAFTALHSGITKISIGNAEFLHDLVDGRAGTQII